MPSSRPASASRARRCSSGWRAAPATIRSCKPKRCASPSATGWSSSRNVRRLAAVSRPQRSELGLQRFDLGLIRLRCSDLIEQLEAFFLLAGAYERLRDHQPEAGREALAEAAGGPHDRAEVVV